MTRKVTYKGVTYNSRKELCDKLEIDYKIVTKNLKEEYTLEAAVNRAIIHKLRTNIRSFKFPMREFRPKARLVWDIRKTDFSREIIHGEYRCKCGYLRYKVLNPDDIEVCGHCGSHVEASEDLYTYDSYSRIQDCFEVFNNWYRLCEGNDRDLDDLTVDVVDVQNDEIVETYHLTGRKETYMVYTIKDIGNIGFSVRYDKNKKEEDN